VWLLSRRVALAIASIMCVIALAACGNGTPSPDGADTTQNTRGGTTTSLGASGDQAVVEAAADSYPEPDGVPWDYLSLSHVEWLAYCTKAFGFESVIMNEPGQPPTLFTNVAGEQRFRLSEVHELCTAEAQKRGWVKPALPAEAELRAEYGRLVATNDCLTQLGYGTDPVSWDTYRETRDWNVYANTPRGSALVVAPSAGTDLPEDVRLQLSIQEACPLWAPPG
jgi:hypothetical protein